MSAMQSFFSVIFCLLFVQLLNLFFDIAEWSKKKYSNPFFCTLLMFWLTILFKKTTKIKTVHEHESLKYWCLNAFLQLFQSKKFYFSMNTVILCIYFDIFEYNFLMSTSWQCLWRFFIQCMLLSFLEELAFLKYATS